MILIEDKNAVERRIRTLTVNMSFQKKEMKSKSEQTRVKLDKAREESLNRQWAVDHALVEMIRGWHNHRAHHEHHVNNL